MFQGKKKSVRVRTKPKLIPPWQHWCWCLTLLWNNLFQFNSRGISWAEQYREQHWDVLQDVLHGRYMDAVAWLCLLWNGLNQSNIWGSRWVEQLQIKALRCFTRCIAALHSNQERHELSITRWQTARHSQVSLQWWNHLCWQSNCTDWANKHIIQLWLVPTHQRWCGAQSLKDKSIIAVVIIPKMQPLTYKEITLVQFSVQNDSLSCGCMCETLVFILSALNEEFNCGKRQNK